MAIPEFLTRPANWLLPLGGLAIVAAFGLGWAELVVYEPEMQFYVSAYVALQVVGWLALIEWYRAD